MIFLIDFPAAMGDDGIDSSRNNARAIDNHRRRTRGGCALERDARAYRAEETVLRVSQDAFRRLVRPTRSVLLHLPQRRLFQLFQTGWECIITSITNYCNTVENLISILIFTCKIVTNDPILIVKLRVPGRVEFLFLPVLALAAQLDQEMLEILFASTSKSDARRYSFLLALKAQTI